MMYYYIKHTCIWGNVPGVLTGHTLCISKNQKQPFPSPSLELGHLRYTSDCHEEFPGSASIHLPQFHILLPHPSAQKWLSNWLTSRFSIYSRWKMKWRRQMTSKIRTGVFCERAQKHFLSLLTHRHPSPNPIGYPSPISLQETLLPSTLATQAETGNDP